MSGMSNSSASFSAVSTSIIPVFVAIAYSLSFGGIPIPSRIAIAVLSDNVSCSRISISLLINLSLSSAITAKVSAIETQF